MTIQISPWAALSIADGTILSSAVLGGTIGTVQPTSGNRWVWNATTGMPERTLDAVANYVRDDIAPPGTGVTTTHLGGLRWFDWSGVASGATIPLINLRSDPTPADSQRVTVQITSAGLLRLTYNAAATLAGTSFDMTTLPAGRYAVEVQADVLTSAGFMKAWLYSDNLATTHASISATGLVFTAMTTAGRYRFGGALAGTSLTIDRLPHGIVSMAGDTLSDNMLKTAWLAAAVFPPNLVLDRVSNSVVDARGSSSGAAGTLTYTTAYVSGQDNHAGIRQLGTGVLSFPEPTTGTSTYRITVTESGTSMTDYEDVVIAAGAGGTPVNSIIFEVWTGAAWS